MAKTQFPKKQPTADPRGISDEPHILARYGKKYLIKDSQGRILGKVQPIYYSNLRWYGTYCWEAYPQGAVAEDALYGLDGKVIPGAIHSKKPYRDIKGAALAVLKALTEAV